MLSKALQKLVIPGLLAVRAVLLVAGTAAGSAFYDFRPVATSESAASGEAGGGAYQLPPGVGGVTVNVSAFGYLPADETSGQTQFLYVRLSIANAGDRPFTVIPAASSFFDDLGHRVVGAALFSGQTRLTSGTVGPGGQDDLQLGFALPSNTSFGTIGGLSVQWAYMYGNQSYVAETQLAKSSGNVYTAPTGGGYTPGGPTAYVVPDSAYVSPIYLDTYSSYWGGYPWWIWSGFGSSPWWDFDLCGDIGFGRFHNFFGEGRFFGRDFDHDRDDAFFARGRVVPSDRFNPAARNLLARNTLGANNIGNFNRLNTNLVHNNGVATGAARTFNAPLAGKMITPGATTITPGARTFTTTPHITTTTPQTFTATPRTFTAAPHVSSSTPARTFSAPAPHFSGGGASTFHSSGGGFSGGAAHVSGGGGGGGGHGGGHR
jgi:hypothetical protein